MLYSTCTTEPAYFIIEIRKNKENRDGAIAVIIQSHKMPPTNTVDDEMFIC
jgi:hypothetical protein